MPENHPHSPEGTSPLLSPQLESGLGNPGTRHSSAATQATMSVDSHDFSDAPKEPTVTFDVDIEAQSQAQSQAQTLRPPGPARAHSQFSESGISIHNPPPESLDPHGVHGDQDPIVRNRKSRNNTMWQTFPSVIDNPRRLGWQPGQEPGLDPSQPDGGRPSGMGALQQECDITVVDFSEGHMVMRNMNNRRLVKWIEEETRKENLKRELEQEENSGSGNKYGKGKKGKSHEHQENDPDWFKCRWINVNGLSWDVIKAIAKYKKLHKLALEDLVNTKNRTKADWYSDQTYIILTLQKLVKTPPVNSASSSDFDSDDDTLDDNASVKCMKGSLKRGRTMQLLDKLLGRGSPQTLASNTVPVTSQSSESHRSDSPDKPTRNRTREEQALPRPRTLQRYNGGPNLERMEFMEQNSAFKDKDVQVCAEQVSIFLLGDNTVVSFFESSAEDIETPILKRLATPETVLRRSCEGSMLVQAIIDAIIDMAIPVATKYSEVIQDLELRVLTNPTISNTQELYILTSEVTTMRNFISPIAVLVRTMRDHKGQALATINKDLQNSGDAHHVPRSNVEISPLAAMYLADVEDHTLSILADLEQISQSAAGLISLIFNTISALQNESMKQLTTATIIFLPMTFITGYFGMNFEGLMGLKPQDGPLGGTDKYFWVIAAPVAFVTIMLLLWGDMRRSFERRWWNKLGRKTKRKLGGDRWFGRGRRRKAKTV